MKEIIIKGLDEKVLYEKMPNGLDVYMWVNEKVNNFYMTLNVKYGSVDTEFKLEGEKKFTKVTDGIAHFLEHVNFNINDNETAHELFEKLGSSINAFTTYNFTAYEVFASNNFQQNLTYLLDYVQTPYFTKALVEKEKGIICEEVKMGKNRPGHKLYYGLYQALFKKDKKRRLITGEVKDVKKITAEELQLVYDNFYHPENMFVVITGNFDPTAALKIIKKNQAAKTFPQYRHPLVKKIKEPQEVNLPYQEIEANVELPKIKIAYKMSEDLFEGLDENVLNIHLGAILRNNFGNTSLLREELLEKELVTSLGAGKTIDNNMVVIELSAETRYPDKVIKILKNQIKKMTITKEDIIRRRRANIAALINDFDDIEYVNTDIADQIITYGKLTDNMFELYNNTSLELAQKIISKLDLTNCSTVVLVPYEEK